MPIDSQLRRWCAAVVVIFFAGGLGLASCLSRTPHVRDVLDASTSQMSGLIVALSAGSMIGMLLASHVDSALGSRRAMLVFAVVIQVGLFIAAIGTGAASFLAVAVGLAVFGLGTGIVDVVMNVSAAAAEQRRGKTMMPIFHAMFSLGTLAGASLGVLSEQLDVPMTAHIGTVVVINLVAVGWTNRWVQQPTVTHDAPMQSARQRLSAWRERPTLLIGLVVLGMALAEGAANDWLALTLVDGHAVSNETAAAGLGVFLAAMTAVRLFGVKLVDAYGRVPVLRVCAGSAFAGLSLMIFVDNAIVAFIGVALWGAGAALGFPLGMSAAADDPRHAAARVSVVSTIGYLAFLVAPPVIGFVGELAGLRRALLVVLVAILLAGLLSSAVRERSDLRVRTPT